MGVTAIMRMTTGIFTATIVVVCPIVTPGICLGLLVSTGVLARTEVIRFDVAAIFEIWRFVCVGATGVLQNVFRVFELLKVSLFSKPFLL